MAVPPRDRHGLRTGFTTGACAAAAARAATRVLVREHMISEIESILPDRDRVVFSLARCERDGDWALCSIIKDAGDDPDCTHGAEIVARVAVQMTSDIEILGGEGVARVTKPGLGLVVGGPAINPVPHKNIRELVELELQGSAYAGATVVVSVPNGEEMAKKTTNAAGLIGGISILGTSGIVKPYSTAAYKASVVQAINVAHELGNSLVVLTTGGRSEIYAMGFFPELGAEAFVQVGDFIGVALKHAARRGLIEVRIVAMMGKLSKMADGVVQTHQAGSDVNFELLSELAATLGAPESLLEQIRGANTARNVLELCQEHHFNGLPDRLCERAAAQLSRHIAARLLVDVTLVDFDGTKLGHFAQPAHPPTAPASPANEPPPSAPLCTTTCDR